LAAAKAQLGRGDLQAAETSLWAVLTPSPDNEEALNMLGTIRERQQRYAEAEALFGRVLQINAKSAAAHLSMARVLAVQRKTPAAIEQYKAAQVLSPHDARLKVELARLYLSIGQFEPAVSELEAIPPAEFPADAIPVKAAAFLADGRKGDAIRLIDSAKRSPEAELGLAEVFLDGNLPDQALRCLDLAAVDLNRHPSRFNYLKGRALAAKGDSESGLAALQQAIAADPKSVDALVALSEVYSRQNKHADAVTVLEKAQGLKPDSLPVLRHLVVEATKAGKAKAAVDAASALSEKSPDNPDDLYLAGAALLQQNVQGASTVLEKFVALRPDNAKGWMALGMAYVQQEKYSQARKPLEQAIALDDSMAEAHYQLGLVAKNEAKAEEAIQHLQQAVQLQPGHEGALRTLGNLYLQSGELEKAQAALEQAEKINGNNLQTEYDLGLVLNKLGKTDQARLHMERYRKLKEAGSSEQHN
jgi:tetratricopeptide (TPR) repeat protein